MGAGAVAIIIAREKHIVDVFRRARAMDPRSAVAPATIGVTERIAFRKLLQHAVLREANPGTFYLDEPSWEALRSQRRRLGIVLLVVVLLAAVIFWMKVP